MDLRITFKYLLIIVQFCILPTQWFNLDSLLKKPKLVSDTYLCLFLTQLQMEGMLL